MDISAADYKFHGFSDASIPENPYSKLSFLVKADSESESELSYEVVSQCVHDGCPENGGDITREVGHSGTAEWPL